MVRIEGDRLIAFLIVDGKVYSSDCDHQECLNEWLIETGQKPCFSDDDDAYYEEKEKAVKRTFSMKCEHEAFGFDLFDASDLDYVLLAHDKDTLDANLPWAKQYCKDNSCKLAYFINGWDAKVVPA